MKKTCALAATLACAISTNANATLIEHSLWTYDTETELEWLDVPLTMGFTAAQVLGGAGGYITDGWRYATGAEIDSLAQRYVGGTESVFHAYQLDPALEMARRLGLTFDQPYTFATIGLYDDGLSNGLFGLGTFQANWSTATGENQFEGRWSTVDGVWAPDFLLQNAGSYLVRSAGVPEPELFALFGLGSLLLGWGLKRRGSRLRTA